MKFYEKFGNDLFSPNINVTNILLDNSNDSQLGMSNGVTIDFEVLSKQNALDNWLSDLEYLNYSEITAIAFQNKEDIDSFRQSVSNKEYIEKSIPQILDSINSEIQYKNIVISDIYDTQQTTTDSQLFGNSQTSFNSLDAEKDIILYFVPTINFVKFLSNNDYSSTNTYELIKKFYSLEWHVYNVLIKNKTIDDEISKKVLNDVRDIKELTTNLFSLISTTISSQILNENPSYISDVFTSFDYDKKQIRSYLFFDIRKYINESSVFSNVFNSYTQSEIDSKLIENKAINFEIYKETKSDEQFISAFSTSFSAITGSTNVSIIKELSNDKIVCFSVADNFPVDSRQNFKYKINVNFQDVFIKKYYDNTTNPPSGDFYTLSQKINEIENFVNDPRNTNAVTGKFNIFSSASEAQPVSRPNISQTVNLFVNLYNLFANKPLDNEKKNKIIKALNYTNSTFQIHVDFVYIVKSLLLQIEQLFMSVGYTKQSYTKTSSNIKYENKLFYFKVEDFTNKTIPKVAVSLANVDNQQIQYYVESEKNYNLLKSNVDYTNEIGYKITNAYTNLSNDQLTYYPNYNLLSLVSEQAGTTIEQIDLTIPKQPEPLLSKTSVLNDTVQKPSVSMQNSKKQILKSTEETNSKNISNIISNISLTKQVDTLSQLTFQTNFLNDLSLKTLVPKIKTQFYIKESKQWVDAAKVAEQQTIAASYLARTNYDKGTDIFTSNNMSPPLSNMYYIFTVNK